MGIYYSVCAWKIPTALLIITILLNICILLSIIALGFRDPGIIPKIFKSY
jgi:RsiW-degrading membrane proteinase PrsW (M82 family)